MRAVLVLVAVLLAPVAAHAQAWRPETPVVDDERPSPARAPMGHDDAVLVPGVVMLLGGFFTTVIGTSAWYSQDNACAYNGWFSWTCTHHDLGDAALFLAWVPLVGPWLMLGDPQLSGASYVWPIAAGLVQDVGFVLMLVGLLDTHPVDAVRVRPFGSASSAGITIEGVL